MANPILRVVRREWSSQMRQIIADHHRERADPDAEPGVLANHFCRRGAVARAVPERLFEKAADRVG